MNGEQDLTVVEIVENELKRIDVGSATSVGEISPLWLREGKDAVPDAPLIIANAPLSVRRGGGGDQRLINVVGVPAEWTRKMWKGLSEDSLTS